MKRIAITTGDVDGIGLEITQKAISKIEPPPGFQFLVFSQGSGDIESEWSHVSKTRSSEPVVSINSRQSPVEWVRFCGKKALSGDIGAIVTGPMSKTLVSDFGGREIGHTEIFSGMSETSDVFMSFWGRHFNVLVATGHIPLQDVPKALSADKITTSIRLALKYRFVDPDRSHLPVGVLGLNPHCGEEGLIGSFEKLRLIPTLESLRSEGLPIEGPLVPDAAFFQENLKRFSVFVSLYHDQGLIPFKMAHQHSGVHMTCGLPFIRTSVDHGTAKNIFGLNRADSTSMTEALLQAIRMCQYQNIERKEKNELQF